MNIISVKDYSEFIKKEREKRFLAPFELVYKNFVSFGYDKKGNDFFANNASQIVENLRDKCWKDFVPDERRFTSDMLQKLIVNDAVKDKSPEEAITWFIEEYPEHIYTLTLSNTQSRRSRAGKEFESIIELILAGAGIPMDAQANIGKKAFESKGLGKLVDVVSPSVVEYIIDKSDTVLISAKTTLRERWQEVPEEMGRTGAREMFLATLDEGISDEVLDTLYEANIRVTTTRRIKETYYKDSKRVLDFEKLVEICKNNFDKWHEYDYSAENKEQITTMVEVQKKKHEKHDFMLKYYNDRLNNLN